MGKMNFDEAIIRRGTGSAKWDGLEGMFGIEDASDVIPMWVADADFLCAPEIGAAVKKAVELEIYGYKFGVPGTNEAIIGWQSKRFGFEAKPEWITTITGVVAAVTAAVQAYTNEGDGVIIQSPVYYPFANTIKANNRVVMEAPLKETENDGILHYEIDFDVFEEVCAKEEAKMLILCSPHNPLGRVWTEEELRKIGEITRKHNVFVVSDEIHSDIIVPGGKFTSFLKVNPESYGSAIMTSSASKSFNIAGLHYAYVIIPCEDNMAKYRAVTGRNSASSGSYVGAEALSAAYTQAEYYVEEFNEYVAGNMEYMVNFVKENLPQVRIVKPEGTYLVWVDITKMIAEDTDVNRFMADEAKVACDPGYWFGESYKGYIRMNAATTRANVVESMNRLKAALEK